MSGELKLYPRVSEHSGGSAQLGCTSVHSPDGEGAIDLRGFLVNRPKQYNNNNAWDILAGAKPLGAKVSRIEIKWNSWAVCGPTTFSLETGRHKVSSLGVIDGGWGRWGLTYSHGWLNFAVGVGERFANFQTGLKVFLGNLCTLRIENWNHFYGGIFSEKDQFGERYSEEFVTDGVSKIEEFERIININCWQRQVRLRYKFDWCAKIVG